MSPEIEKRAAILFGALSYPTRLQIVKCLLEQPLSVGEVSTRLGILHSSASQHLSVLARAGIAKKEQQGAQHVYSLRGPRIKLILGLIEEFCRIHALYGDDSIGESAENRENIPV